MRVNPGSTDQSFYFKLRDANTGQPLTGLTITGVDIVYIRDRAAAVKADATALGAVDGAHADNEAIEVSATLAPGLYRVDFPDAAFATGVDRVRLMVVSATTTPEDMEIELAYNLADADAVIDDSGSPWELVYLLPGTATESLRKHLYQVDDTAVTAATHVVGQQLKTAL